MLIHQKPHQQTIFSHYLYRKPQPNVSIKLQQVQQKTKHTFICECQMCRQYDGKKILQILEEKTQNINRKVSQKVRDSKVPSEYFLEILKKLVLPVHKIVKRGIDIYIPQICFFKDGESKGIFMNRELDDFSIKKIHKNSVNPGLIAKIFNQRRRAYKQDLKKSLGITQKRTFSKQKAPSYQKNSQKQPQQNLQQKQAVVLKHTDGFQSMMTQTQFIMLTLKRKQDPIWKTIQIIKNLINVPNQKQNIFFVKYEKQKIKYENLLERAKILVRIYGQNIIPGQTRYISQEEENNFCTQLCKTDKISFAEYVVYKIVSFVEYYFDEEIVKLSCKLLINQLNKPYLIDVTNYKKKSLMRFAWTNQIYKKKVSQQQAKMFQNVTSQPTQQLQQKAEKIKSIMEHKYSEMKNKYGISLQQSDNQEEIKNNQFFKKIHPEFNGLELSEVLMNEKNMSVNKFRRKYLGYKEERKPLVKEFSTHMIKVLHKTTPKLKVSVFHQVNHKASQSGFFSSRRPTTCQGTKRSATSILNWSPKKISRKSSVQQSFKIQNKIKTKQSTSRVTTSATYRRSGCHLHISGNDSIALNILNLHK